MCQFLEEDIDADDPVVAEAGELEGEELLATLALASGELCGQYSTADVASLPNEIRTVHLVPCAIPSAQSMTQKRRQSPP